MGIYHIYYFKIRALGTEQRITSIGKETKKFIGEVQTKPNDILH